MEPSGRASNWNALAVASRTSISMNFPFYLKSLSKLYGWESFWVCSLPLPPPIIYGNIFQRIWISTKSESEECHWTSTSRHQHRHRHRWSTSSASGTRTHLFCFDALGVNTTNLYLIVRLTGLHNFSIFSSSVCGCVTNANSLIFGHSSTGPDLTPSVNRWQRVEFEFEFGPRCGCGCSWLPVASCVTNRLFINKSLFSTGWILLAGENQKSKKVVDTNN